MSERKYYLSHTPILTVAEVEVIAKEALEALRPPSPTFQVGDRIKVTGTGSCDGTFEVTEVPDERPEPWAVQSFTSRRVHDEEQG